jgi:hypothetical protein
MQVVYSRFILRLLTMSYLGYSQCLFVANSFVYPIISSSVKIKLF